MENETIETDAMDDSFTVAAEAMKLANVMMYCHHMQGANNPDNAFKDLATKAGEMALRSLTFAESQIQKPTFH